MFEKLYRPAVLVLLSAILIVQVIGMQQSAECKIALANALLTQNVATKQTLDLAKDYHDDVYNKATNINQQISWLTNTNTSPCKLSPLTKAPC